MERFLPKKQLEDENGKSGNYGYYDQYTAIQWVRHNIEAIGGDPSRMTLIGQSAGAASAEAQIKSPLNRGVFQGAIIQSSAGFTTVLKAKDNRESVYRKWEALYRQSGCKSIDEFRKMPVEQLYALFEKVSEKNPIGYATTVYDENFTGNAKNAPCSANIICSFTSQDVMPLLLFLLCKMLAKSQRGSAETYGYYFQRQLPGDTYGAWHGSDLWYTYGTLHRSWRPFSDEDRKLSEIMMDYFVQFIKTGNPNCRNHPEWKPLTEKKFMIFDADKSQMGRPALGSLLKATLFPQKFEK